MSWFTVLPGAVITAIALLGIGWKTLRILFRLDRALPTLLAISEEFHENGGNSLKDHMVAVTERLTTIDETLSGHTATDDVRFARLEGILLGKQSGSGTVVVVGDNPEMPKD